MVRRAVGLMRRGRFDDAGALCRKVLEQRPDDLDARELLGVIALQTARFQEAAGLFARILESQPDNPDHLVNHGSALMALGHIEEAISGFQQALEIDGGHGNAHLNLGLALRQSGRDADSVGPLREAARLMPENPAALTNLGVSLNRVDDAQQGLEYLRKAAELAPAYVIARVNLGAALWDLGDFEAAVAEFDAALDIEPRAAALHFERGRTLNRLGRSRQAVKAYGRAVGLDDDLAAAHHNLAVLMTRRGRAEEAIDHARKAVALEPRNRDFRLALGNILAEAGRESEARIIFESLEQEFPEFSEALVAHAKLLQNNGDFELAREVISILREINPDPSLYFPLLAADGDAEFSDDDVNEVEAIIKRADRPAGGIGRVCFAVGEVMERRGRFDDAFGYYVRGNQIRNREHGYDPDAVRQYTNRLIETFDETFFAERQDFGLADDRPVFVVGMTRSGTSLVEQILASHRWVGGAGELGDFQLLSDELPEMLGQDADYPGCAPNLDGRQAKTIGGVYLNRLSRRFPDARRYTDKLPTNFLNLGLIALCLPRAQVLHCRRGPMATCFSIYSASFAEGHSYAYDPENVAHFYAEYERLMDHWRRLNPVAMLEVHYEDLVADTETITRQMLDFCGLDWDEDCLRFNETNRKVKTAGNWQVRQPIYSSSVTRWRNFEPHLGPLRDALERHGIDPEGGNGA